MRRMTGWVIALLMMWGFACAEQVALPWSMTWETTPAEYVRVLEANMGEGCTIAALRDGSAQIDLTISRGDYSVSCRAVFDGGKGRDRVAFVTLDELAGEPLRLSWLAIDVAPAGKDMDFDAAMEMYQRFTAALRRNTASRRPNASISRPRTAASVFPTARSEDPTACRTGIRFGGTGGRTAMLPIRCGWWRATITRAAACTPQPLEWRQEAIGCGAPRTSLRGSVRRRPLSSIGRASAPCGPRPSVVRRRWKTPA